MITRIDRIFAALKVRGQKAMITYIMAGYPDYETGLAIMKTLPESGADVIELGIPFSDPIADGASIQVAGMRALRNGQTLQKTIKMVHAFRQNNNKTPVVVMGYYNPIYVYGVDRFLRDAQIAGVDGILVVDLPPEMDQELCIPARQAGISFIRIATPTTDDKRRPIVLQNTSGFIYYVSMTGITGQTLTNSMEIALSVKQIKAHTALPVAVGFGIKTADQVAKMSAIADGVIVGTAIINAITSTLDGQGKIVGNPIEAVDILVRNLHSSV
ncbi:MAG: tryptophan synthase alpha chain [Candidatus Tokpelaia sp. JSC085]|nr:MAG: tryptophan synthase alpha chain [Candidatus Tokpelaia sp. JSC085]